MRAPHHAFVCVSPVHHSGVAFVIVRYVFFFNISCESYFIFSGATFKVILRTDLDIYLFSEYHLMKVSKFLISSIKSSINITCGASTGLSKLQFDYYLCNDQKCFFNVLMEVHRRGWLGWCDMGI